MNETLKHIFSILLPAEKRTLAVQFLSDLLINLLDIAFLAALVYVLNFYTGNGTAVPPQLFTDYPLLLITAFFMLFSGKNLLAHVVVKRQFDFVYCVAARLSRQKLLQYLKGNFHDHVHTDSSVWLKSISQQPIEFGHHVLSGIQQIAGQLVLVLFTAVAILIYDPALLFLLLCILTVPVILTAVLLKKKMKAVRAAAKPVSEKTIQHLNEAVAGYIESNIYQKHDFFINRYEAYQSGFNRFLARQLSIQNLPSRLLEVFALLGLFVLILMNQLTKGGAVSLVTLGAFMAAAYKIIPAVVKILNCSGQVRTYQYTIANLLPVRRVTGQPVIKKCGKIESLSMQQVEYAINGRALLNACSFDMVAGDMLGISGISGKGKTTLTNLLSGFIEETGGEIRINQAAADATMRARYREQMAYVKQQNFLLHGSIRENITLDETLVDERKLGKALQATGLDGLIDQYPEGLEKIITENGKNISGGQRQRIAIARALYKDADLVLLDEPFNELDPASEEKLLTHFESLSASGKMIILISHKKESLSFCNKRLHLDA